MAIVRAFSIEGLKTWFWSADHNPPHFHAKRSGDWELKVHFLNAPSAMIEVLWANKQPSRSALRELISLAEAHRVELLEQWKKSTRTIELINGDKNCSSEITALECSQDMRRGYQCGVCEAL